MLIFTAKSALRNQILASEDMNSEDPVIDTTKVATSADVENDDNATAIEGLELMRLFVSLGSKERSLLLEHAKFLTRKSVVS